MIMSDRDEFVGVHVTPEAREALEKERTKTGKSISKLVWEAVRKSLIETGYPIKEVA
jgi:hypothetical protein